MSIDVARRVELRAADPADAAAIRGLEGLSPSSARLLDQDLGRDDRRCLVAVDHGASDVEVVGYAALVLQADAAHVLDVVVAPDRRGRGIGRQLMEGLLRAAADEGPDRVTLEVADGNAPAIALYRRLGFVVEGNRPRYYPDGSDALILWRRGDEQPEREDR